MKRSTYVLSLFVLLAICYLQLTKVSGQKENNMWAFGVRAGIDFNSGSPVPFTTAIDQMEGAASVCDADGRLLFYTDGSRIWNRNHELMQNGRLIAPNPSLFLYDYPTQSTSQAAAIVPMPGNNSLYYVFSLEAMDNYEGKVRTPCLYYSLVDMRLGNGLGDVVPGMKMILLDTGMSEKLTVVQGEDCNVWLLTKPIYQGVYYTYNITSAGIDTVPVVSVVGLLSPESYTSGPLVAAHNGSMLVAANWPHGWLPNSHGGIELYDFDKSTGIISNERVLAYSASCRGACFSPNDSLLYISGLPTFSLYQFNVSLGTVAAITASATEVGSSLFAIKASMRLGPDGKIYVANQNIYLHVIERPNVPGLGCTPVNWGVQLAPGSHMLLGLNADIATAIKYKDTISTIRDISMCFRDSILVVADSPGQNYIWADGILGRTRTISQPGIYIVSYQDRCVWRVDTMHVRSPELPVAGASLYSCAGQRQGSAWVIPAPGDTTLLFCVWKDSTGNILKQYQSNRADTLTELFPGRYTVHITTSAGCDTMLEVFIEPVPVPSAAFSADSIVCRDVLVKFENQSGAPVSLWDFGDGTGTDATTDPIHVYRETGDFIVTLIVENMEHCKDTVKKALQVKEFDIVLSAGETVVDRYSSVMLETLADEPYSVLAWLPSVLFSDQSAVSQQFAADTTRRYTVIGRSVYGCLDTADVWITVNPIPFLPSAFTPDGDGRNDFFRLRNWGDIREVREFRIYDRWGKTVWQSSGATAFEGWDGTTEGVPASVGVYFYRLTFRSSDNSIVVLKGDLTLLR